MNCSEVLAWLDDGMPQTRDRAARARLHAASCASCRSALDAAIQVERLLAEASIVVPAGLAERTMARVAGSRRGVPFDPAATPPLAAWWLRILTDPAVVLASCLAGLLVGRPGAIGAVARQLGAALTHPVVEWTSHLLPSLPAGSPVAASRILVIAIALGLAPLAVGAALPLFGWAARWADGRALRPLRRRAA